MHIAERKRLYEDAHGKAKAIGARAANKAMGNDASDNLAVAFTADTAEKTGTSERAKQAHDTLIVEVHRSQAHALAIPARAEMRLAEEYDAAQERGEVKRNGGDRSTVEDRNTASAADLRIRRDEIHEARKLRDAERDDYLPLRAASSSRRIASERETFSALAHLSSRATRSSDSLAPYIRSTPVAGLPGFRLADIDFAINCV